jgi:putative nucleotidyltransferase with HDIG domain
MIARQDLEAALARALDLISSQDLRRQVVDTWMLALEEGGWKSMDELRAMPFTLLAETRGLSFLEHTLAVTLGAVGLAKGQLEVYAKMPYAIDLDRLVAGGILHDVGKLLEIQRKPEGGFVKSRAGQLARHPISGAILAARCGLAPEIINMIACHAKEGDGAPKVVETVFVHQADFATFDPLVMAGKGMLIP